MRHPSIRFRLMLGTVVLVAVLLSIANLSTYRAYEHTLRSEIDRQLRESISLLAKSAELEADSLDYEWEEALKSSQVLGITGLFEFWDVNSGRITRSPDLLSGDLPFFHSELNHPVLRDITLADGSRARAVGLLHYPFTDELAISEAAKVGKELKPENYPQVVVCAREMESVYRRLDDLKKHLTRSAIGTLAGICIAIFVIFTLCLRPIHRFSANLMERSDQDSPPLMEIPRNMPYEIAGLAKTFNLSLEKVEKARAREKEFALHAAHELRTPVAGILATLEQAIRRPRDSAELAKRIGTAIEITSGMSITLDSLMRLARLRGHLEVMEKSDFDPAKVIEDVLHSCADIVGSRQITIERNFPANPPPLHNDPGLFRVLVSNLIENAVHYSPVGSVVELRIENTPDRFLFETRNACAGIAPGPLDHLFQPFQRGAAPADSGNGHAGIGLSLASEAAHLMGGRVHAELEGTGEIVFSATLMR